MDKKRVLLAQSPISQLALHSALIDCGWEVHVAPDVESARMECRRRVCQVGIAVLDPLQAWTPDTLEQSILQGALQWIAVVPRKALQDSAWRRTLAQCFFDFHTLPVDMERLDMFLGHALGKASLAASVDDPDGTAGVPSMVGSSAPMTKLYRSIRKVAMFEAPVMISGESGTGKEVTARAIHQLSARRHGPFIPVNCGSLPVHLVHSELFGHEKGSFTGAYQRKVGSIEAADGGIIFLDEIGDLPLELQSSLLRFLQEKTIVRVGSTRNLQMNVRVVAASHVNLQESVNRGRFREDLYYRLNVLPLHVPALRERPDDIPLLAHAFFEQASAQRSPQVAGFSTAALRAMEAYGWPGNVRELMNRVQKAMIMCDERLISPADLGLGAGAPAASDATRLRTVRGATERDVIHHTLVMNGRNKAAAARQLGVSRTTLYRLLHKCATGVPQSEPEAKAGWLPQSGHAAS